MALKLTRRVGESIIVKYTDRQGNKQQLRILVRRLKRSGSYELEYSSSVNAFIQSSSNDENVLLENKHASFTHLLNDDIVLSAKPDKGHDFVMKFGVESHAGLQARLWFEAPKCVEIIRDELDLVA